MQCLVRPPGLERRSLGPCASARPAAVHLSSPLLNSTRARRPSLLRQFALSALPLRLYAAYDCNLRRTDLLTHLSAALAEAARPTSGMALDGGNVRAALP